MNLPEDVFKNIESFDDLVDLLLHPIKDYTDIIGDLAQPVRALYSIYSLRKRFQLKSFIKGYNRALGENKLTEEDKQKLVKYFEKEKNILLISEILESAISSLSVKSSALLGVIAGRVLLNKSESLSNSDYVLIGALKNLTDIDLDLFNQLVKFIKNSDPPFRETDHGMVEYRFRDIYKAMNHDQIPFERDQMEAVTEKLKNLGVLSYSAGGIGSYGNDRGAFMFSKYSEVLNELIQTTLPN